MKRPYTWMKNFKRIIAALDHKSNLAKQNLTSTNFGQPSTNFGLANTKFGQILFSKSGGEGGSGRPSGPGRVLSGSGLSTCAICHVPKLLRQTPPPDHSLPSHRTNPFPPPPPPPDPRPAGAAGPGTPLRRTAQNFALFVTSPRLKFHSLCSLWASSRGISVLFAVLGGLQKKT